MTAGAFNLFALPLVVSGLATLTCGLLVLVRERASLVGVLYCVATAAAGTWLLAYVGAYLSVTPEQALPYTRLSQAGVTLIPPSLFHFTNLLLQLRGPSRRLIAPVWVLSLIFTASALYSDAFCLLPHKFYWGYYANYGWLGMLFHVFLALSLSSIVYLLWQAQRHPESSPLERKRSRLLLIGFGVGFIAIVDALPAYGISIYPVGHLSILFLIATVGYTTWKYRLQPITPGQAAAQIIESMNDILIVVDREGTVRLANPRALALLAEQGRQSVGKSISIVLPELDFESHRQALELSVAHGGGEIELTGPAGEVLHLSVSVSLRRDADRQPAAYVYLLHDVSAAHQIHQLSHFNSVTDLPNRPFFHQRLQESLKEARSANAHFAVLSVDLNRFKRVNDAVGHPVGDELLRAIASRLQAGLSAAGCSRILMGHFGREEFVASVQYDGTRATLVDVLGKLLTLLGEPLRAGSYRVSVSASIGVSLFPQDGDEAEVLSKKAGAAMHLATEGGNGFQFFDEWIDRASTRRLRLETELVHALDQKQFELEYQPQVDARRGTVVGFETLLRWRHPSMGMVAPTDFVPMAETSGLIIPVGAWVLEASCAEAIRWGRRLQHPLRVCVNVSGVQFNGVQGVFFVGLVRRVLEQTGLDPAYLELEMTESVVMHQGEQTLARLMELKALGVRLAIDDFGTGYSSLSYLTRFPIDVLKIDQSFVRDLPGSSSQEAILRTIIGMAHSLDLELVAEGVETREQVDFLLRHHCHIMQGYYFARPMSAADAEAFAREGGGVAAPIGSPGTLVS